MVSLIKIKKAIALTIENAIVGTEFNNVQILTNDVRKNIIRPSIQILLDKSSFGKFNSKNTERECKFEIYFFVENEYKYSKDNQKMQQILENAFLDDLKIEEGFFIPIDSIECETSDTVLVCRISLYMIELLPDTDTSEPMEEIIYKEGIK